MFSGDPGKMLHRVRNWWSCCRWGILSFRILRAEASLARHIFLGAVQYRNGIQLLELTPQQSNLNICPRSYDDCRSRILPDNLRSTVKTSLWSTQNAQRLVAQQHKLLAWYLRVIYRWQFSPLRFHNWSVIRRGEQWWIPRADVHKSAINSAFDGCSPWDRLTTESHLLVSSYGQTSV